MKISIAMATYNGAKYLDEQLQSFLNQTRQPDELVVSDDRSTDNTIQILKDFKYKAPFEVRLLKNNGRGFNDNFENALKKCSGDLVFISDQDDVWLNNKINTVYNYFKTNSKCQVLIHDLEFCNSDMSVIGQTKIERIRIYDEALNSYVTGMATVVRNEFLKTCLPIPNNTNYDNWIHDCAEVIGLRRILKKVLAMYRRHNTNVTKDSIVNVSDKLSVFYIYKEKIKKTHKDTYLNRLIILCNLNAYLDANKEKLVDKFNVNYDQNKKDLERMIHNLNSRVDILSKNRIFRIKELIIIWYKGGYDEYAGIKSVIKDLLH